MKLLLLLAVLQANDAEKLFRKMEETLTGTKTIQVVCDGDMKLKSGGRSDEHDATVYLSGRRHARLDFHFSRTGRTLDWSVISDGTNVKNTQTGRTQKSPADLAKTLKTLLARGGVMSLSDFSSGRTDPPPLSDFELGKRVREKGRNLRELRFKVKYASMPQPQTTTLWVDEKTFLPVRRIIEMGAWSLTETYNNLKLNGKIKGDKFTIS